MADALDPQDPAAVVRTQLDRVPVRMRENQLTLSAWRMEISSAKSPGAILLVDLPSGAVYRGEGSCLGWSQEKLAALWQALSAAPSGEPAFELPQLG